MNPVTELSAGPRCLARGFSMLTQPGLRQYVVIPIIVNIVLIVGLVSLLGCGGTCLGLIICWGTCW